MVFKVVKFFVKLAIGIMLGLLAFGFVVYVIADGTNTYVKDRRLPYKDASYVVRSHQICESYSVNDSVWHVCSIPDCNKMFLKTSPNKNSCSPEHERQYQEIYKAWMATQKSQKRLKELGIKAK